MKLATGGYITGYITGVWAVPQRRPEYVWTSNESEK